MKKIHFCNSHIAWFSYWNWPEIFSKLQIGQKLSLKREKGNKFDIYAIAIYYKNKKIGYIPRDDNREIAKFIDAGYKKIFSMRINRISPDENPENQIGIIIKIKKNF